jgi:hypothetical protein
MIRWSSRFALAITLLAGCTTLRELGAADTEALLTQAGFTREPADPPTLATATPYKMVHQTRDGEVRYLYLDPACTCVWIGDRAQYEAYYHLAVEQRIEADQADSDAAAWAER